MNLEFPIAVKFRDQENYTMFLSNGDSINFSITENYIQQLYRTHAGLQEYENFVKASCEIHEVISNIKFEEIFEEYKKKETEFLNLIRPKKRLSTSEELNNIMPTKVKKKDQTLEINFDE